LRSMNVSQYFAEQTNRRIELAFWCQFYERFASQSSVRLDLPVRLRWIRGTPLAQNSNSITMRCANMFQLTPTRFGLSPHCKLDPHVCSTLAHLALLSNHSIIGSCQRVTVCSRAHFWATQIR
jgi:hypothetical protein